jgi:CheY-like chemotaxis protein
VTNVILNSVDAMPAGGVLRVSVSEDDGLVAVRFEDTGVGMTEEVRRRCFEPFFTTKGGRGAGLGLSMVFGIVRRHRGRIEVQSKADCGTVVTIRFPVLKKEDARGKTAVKKETEHAPALNILLVEDDARSEGATVRCLELAGHRVSVARTGAKGMEMALAGTYDVVITDRALPDMSGDTVAATIKAKLPAIRVIMLTGFGEVMKEQRERPPGVNIVLSKPTTFKEICDALAAVWAKP